MLIERTASTGSRQTNGATGAAHPRAGSPRTDAWVLRERLRIEQLVDMAPTDIHSLLDVGARDAKLVERLVRDDVHAFALDLVRPESRDPRIVCLQGDARALPFGDQRIDLVACTEVLEHIPAAQLPNVCGEISRVARRFVLIGVPYCQDIRVGRTTCAACGRPNPPWGHVNEFDEFDVFALFPTLKAIRWRLAGSGAWRTNALSTRLLDLAGNPYGSYNQQESCIHCDASIGRPVERTLLQRVATRSALILTHIQQRFTEPSPGAWLHVLFERPNVPVQHQTAWAD